MMNKGVIITYSDVKEAEESEIKEEADKEGIWTSEGKDSLGGERKAIKNSGVMWHTLKEK